MSTQIVYVINFLLLLFVFPRFCLSLRINGKLLSRYHFNTLENSKSSPLKAAVEPKEQVNSEKSLSFVNDVMRPYAMKLHSKDQAKEGQEPQKKPVAAWEPTRQGYLHFLIDSLAVYETLEDIVQAHPQLHGLKNTGLERTTELRNDIEWMLQYDKTLQRSEVGSYGKSYSEYLRQISVKSLPRFVCHYYNQYFAHTAGGIMMGKMFSNKLLEGATLQFYTWKVPDVKVLLNNTKKEIDLIADNWTDVEKQDCLDETMSCFSYSGSLLNYMK